MLTATEVMMAREKAATTLNLLPGDRLLLLEQVGDRYGVVPTCVRNWMKQGQFPARENWKIPVHGVPSGYAWMVPESAVLEWEKSPQAQTLSTVKRALELRALGRQPEHRFIHRRKADEAVAENGMPRDPLSISRRTGVSVSAVRRVLDDFSGMSRPVKLNRKAIREIGLVLGAGYEARVFRVGSNIKVERIAR